MKNLLKKTCLLNFILLCFLGLLFYLSLSYGSAGKLSVFEGIYDLIIGKPTDLSIIIGQMRLPRLILAGLIGATLSLSGASMQSLLHNPLADPSVLGLSVWASVGTVAVYYSGFAAYYHWSVPVASFIGIIFASSFLIWFGHKSAFILALVGMALGAMGTAILSLELNMAPNPYAAYEIMHWLMGSLVNDGLTELYMALPGLLIGGGILFFIGRPIDALALGDDVAQTMGFSPKKTRLKIILGTALSVGSGVAVCGNIAFVGLIVPHIIRLFIKEKPSSILLPSSIAGADLLIGADLITRLPLHIIDLQLGIMTSILGMPIFIFQIIKMRREGVS